MRAALLATAAVVGTTAADPARAQVCAGYPSLLVAPLRVSASAASHRYARTVGGSVAGGRSAYAALSLARTKDDELDAWTIDLGVEGGADVPLGPARRDFLCPLAGLSASFGPNGYLLRDENYRYLEGALGIGLASVLIRGRPVSLVVAGGVRAVHLTVTMSPGPSERSAGVSGWSGNDLYGLFTLAAGIVVLERVTVRPVLSIPFGFPPPDPGSRDAYAVPFGREDGEISLGIALGIGLGPGRRPRATGRTAAP